MSIPAFPAPAMSSACRQAPSASQRLRRDRLWVVGWLLYSLLALGFFAWQDAWLGFMCIGR